MTYTADAVLNPGDQLHYDAADHIGPLTVADPAYDEKGRVVIVEDAAGRVLGNRNRAPRVRRYSRKSTYLRGRRIERAS